MNYNADLIAKILGEVNISLIAWSTCNIPTNAARLTGDLEGLGGILVVSAISVALRQISRALLASPDRAATLRATSWMASGSKALIPKSLDLTISCVGCNTK